MIVPLAVILIFALLDLTFSSAKRALLVAANVPFPLMDGIAAALGVRSESQLFGLRRRVQFVAIILLKRQVLSGH